MTTHADKCKFLIEYDDAPKLEKFINRKQIDINDQMIDGQTLLSFAVSICSMKCIKYLATAPGINIDKVDDNGESALFKACRKYRSYNESEQRAKAKLCKLRDHREKEVMSAVPEWRAKYYEIMTFLIASHANCDLRTTISNIRIGYTCLILFCSRYSAGYDDQIDIETRKGIIKMLLDNGASDDTVNRDRQHPSTIALLNELPEIFRFIIDYKPGGEDPKGVH